MIPLRVAAILVAVLTIGCASAPVPTGDTQSTASTIGVAEPSVGASGDSAAPASIDDSEVLVVDAAVNTGAEVVCREVMLVPSSTIRTRCMTRDDWKRFERMQAQQAQRILRSMRGESF